MDTYFTKQEFVGTDALAFLTKNEAQLPTPKFFHLLESNNDYYFQVRELYIGDESKDTVYPYKVVFPEHFIKRAEQRTKYKPNKLVQKIIEILNGNHELALEVTSDSVQGLLEDGLDLKEHNMSTALIIEGEKFVPIFITGDSFVLCITVIENIGDPLRFRRGTKKLFLSKEGTISHLD